MNALQPISTNHRESSDTYRGAIYRLGHWRVAVCRDGIQFLFQRQRPGKSGVGGAWDSLAFCVTRAALLRRWTAATGDDGASLAAMLRERIRTKSASG